MHISWKTWKTEDGTPPVSQLDTSLLLPCGSPVCDYRQRGYVDRHALSPFSGSRLPLGPSVNQREKHRTYKDKTLLEGSLFLGVFIAKEECSILNLGVAVSEKTQSEAT